VLGVTHAIGGFLAGELIICYGKVPAPEVPVVLAAAVFGSLLPDIDHPESFLGRRAPVVSDAVGLVFGHRGFTHSLLFLGGVFLFLLAIRFKYVPWFPLTGAYALVSGILSHLLFDMANPSTVPLLWPWKKGFRFPLPGIPVGSFFEAVFRAAAVAGVLALFPSSTAAVAGTLKETGISVPGAPEIVRKTFWLAGEFLRAIGESLREVSQKLP